MLRHTILSLICAASLTACAHSEQAGGYGKAEPSGFLQDYSKLRPGTDGEATLVYFIPEIEPGSRTTQRFGSEPVQVWRGEKSDGQRPGP